VPIESPGATALTNRDLTPAPVTSSGPPMWVRSTLVAIVVAPIVAAVVRALRHDWLPVGDSALLFVRARDVLTSHHPLLGSWTSASLSVGEHMNNPGPLYGDLVAPVAKLFSFSSAAAIGVGLVNAASVIGVAMVARAVGGWAMQRWMLVACAVLTWIMGSELLIDIWQPHALLLPFLLFIVLAIGLAVGQGRWLPLAAGVASLLVQTHIGYVFVVATIAVSAVTVWTITAWPIPWSRWRSAARSRATLITVAVLAVLWAQPIWEQLFGAGKGNLARLATNASGGDVKLGMGLGTRFSALVLPNPFWRLRSGFSTLVPPTGTSQSPDGPFVEVTRDIISFVPAAALLVGIACGLVVLGLAARRRNDPVQAAACWIGAGGVLGAPVCLSLVTVGIFFAQHHVRWMWAFGAFVNVVILWAVVDLLASRWRHTAWATAVPVVLTVVLAVASVPYFVQAQGPVADSAAIPVLRKVFRQLEPLAARAPLVYDTSEVRVYEPFSSAVMMRLQELGIEFRVTDDGMVRQLGEHRRADGTETTTVFQLEGVFALLYDGPACRVASASALDPDEEAAARAAADELTVAMTKGRFEFDFGRLDEESAGLVEAASRGDGAAARALVLDGRLGRWIVDGVATGSTPVEWADATNAVRRWVDSTYALFAVGPDVCGPG
jgi:hypothetical protein